MCSVLQLLNISCLVSHSEYVQDSLNHIDMVTDLPASLLTRNLPGANTLVHCAAGSNESKLPDMPLQTKSLHSSSIGWKRKDFTN